VRDITDLTNMKKELENKEELIAQQQNELALLRSLQLNSPFGVVISSRQMKKVMEMSVHVGKFDCTVLIQGESGVGKEIIAQTIVQSSERKEGPFIKINCGAIPETLLESELFGYEKGAFTGADPKGKTGMFEMANKGTILLDEVGEIPISLQVKLLRVLQEKEIIRVGGTKPIKLNIRIIAATNQNLEEMVREGTFREDLYYRINVVSIIIPPLRKRPDDIPALTKHFLHKFNKKYNLNKSISPQLQDLLLTYPWPGNVRELQNLIENLVILTQDDVITPEHLPAKFLEHRNNVTPNLVEINKILPLKEAVNILETNLIKEAMQRFGTTRRAASILKVDQSTLP
jgi:transcriptional regulator with PAS, ATPase and Fis domain